MLSSKAKWLVESSSIPPTTFVIVTNQKCQLYLKGRDAQLKEKDAQIRQLLEILKNK